MSEPFLGSAALAAGTLRRHELRTRYVAVHRDVYISRDAELTAVVRAKAAWLRTRGLEVWADGTDPEEICLVDGIRLTTPVRTAVDLARRYPTGTAVAAIDALARATRTSVDDIMAGTVRPGRHGMARARKAIELVDPGAESPRETWLRLVILRAGFPRPATQVPVYNEFGVLIGVVDLGWRDRRLAVEYEGRHHRMSRERFAKDIRRMDEMIEQSWTVLRITAADTEATVVRRLSAAWDQPTSAAS